MVICKETHELLIIFYKMAPGRDFAACWVALKSTDNWNMKKVWDQYTQILAASCEKQ